MRIGMNPQKEERKLTLTTHHRVVVVVYIPEENGFYKNSFDVFKTCLDSLVSTTNSSCAITVVNNGSYQKVSDFLNTYLKEKKIDTLISHGSNIGKIDAIIGAARGVREKYITMTDADILFVNGWQENVESVFKHFPNAGSVSPIPVKNGLNYGTSSVQKDIVLRRLKFGHADIAENGESYNRYLESINWEKESEPHKKWPVVEKNGFKAIVGSGHQVLTIRREILYKTVPTNPSLVLVGSNSEYYYVDTPIDMAGKWRLSTYNNFAYHMGNTLESWMSDVQLKNEQAPKKPIESVASEPEKNHFFSPLGRKLHVLKKKLVKKIFKTFYYKD